MRNSSAIGPILVGVVIVVLGALFYLRDDRQIDDSLVGVRGLTKWLDANDIPVQYAHRRIRPEVEDLSIRVLPLYDTALKSFFVEDPETNVEKFEEETFDNISAWVVQNKLRGLPTVVALPKWRRGMVDTGVAHEATLIPTDSLKDLMADLDLPELDLRQGGPEFTQRTAPDGTITLFHAQLFDRGSISKTECRPVLSFGYDVLAIACPTEDADHDTIYLSDPDLMNNHGLRLADNAAFVQSWLLNLKGTRAGRIYIDTSTDVLINYQTEDFGEYYERTGEDLGRFFTYPLSVLWALFLVVLGVLYWRGAKVFGPLQRDLDRGGFEQSKTVAIATKAHLLRLSGNDGKMVADFVQSQLHDLAARTLGPHLGHKGLPMYFSHLGRRHGALAKDFERTAKDLIAQAPDLPLPELHRRVSHYATLLEQVTQAHGTK